MKLYIYILFLATYDYKDVLEKSLLFYEAQRSGKLPSDQKVTWRKDSALNDKGNNGEDLTGGYYDGKDTLYFINVDLISGDFVKFGFQMSFAITVIAWGVLDHKTGYQTANALDDALKTIKWGTDYFIKAHTSENEFYAQVASGTVDHNYWGRPEDMTMERPAFKITTSAPGSDLAAETAAALAAASLVFQSVDSAYSATLLQHGIQLFNFANTYRGKYSDAFADVRCCYKKNSLSHCPSLKADIFVCYISSSGYEDELVWGAAWLYRATNDNSYLQVIEEVYPTIQYYIGFNWDQKAGGADVSYPLDTDHLVLLAKLTGDSSYSTKMENYCDTMFNSQQKTPKGLIFI
ncbi:unnamed protein product, partial [Timema podura]|nr:unnamed protein product [Timema podura]